MLSLNIGRALMVELIDHVMLCYVTIMEPSSSSPNHLQNHYDEIHFRLFIKVKEMGNNLHKEIFEYNENRSHGLKLRDSIHRFLSGVHSTDHRELFRRWILYTF